MRTSSLSRSQRWDFCDLKLIVGSTVHVTANTDMLQMLALSLKQPNMPTLTGNLEAYRNKIDTCFETILITPNMED